LIGDTAFNLNIIDTPGLFEVSDDNNSRSNEDILDIIQMCLEMSITKIHVIIFVYNVTQTVNVEDANAFDILSRHFEAFKSNSLLVFTHAEKAMRRINNILNDWKSSPMKKVLEFVGENIIFTGALDADFLDNDENMRSKLLEVVKTQRAHVLTKIVSFSNPVKLPWGIFDKHKTALTNMVERSKQQGEQN